jgi:amino acid transporter
MKKWIGTALIAVAVIALITWMNVYSPAKSGEATSGAALSLTILAGLGVLVGMLALVGIAYKLAGSRQ